MSNVHPYQKLLDDFIKRYDSKPNKTLWEDLKFGAEAAYFDFVKYKSLKQDFIKHVLENYYATK